MFTISLALLGLTVVNWHFDFIAEIAKKSPEIATLLNDALQKVLAVPLEWQPSYSIVRLSVKLGADASVIAPGSRAVTVVPSGTIKTQPVHPDVQPALSSPASDDLDNLPDWTEPSTAPADAPAITDGPLSQGDVTASVFDVSSQVATEETPLQKALETNKAGK